MTELKIYKIRDKDNGLYSTGGTSPRWTKHGKTWNSIGSVKTHINNWSSAYSSNRGEAPQGWEIVEFVLHEEESNKWPVNAYINELKRRDAIRKNFGYTIDRALNQMKDIDTALYRYALEFSRYGEFDAMVRSLKEYGFTRNDYRTRTPVIALTDFDKAMMVKLAHGDVVAQFVDFVELKQIEI